MAKKKEKMTEAAKKVMLAEVKRFATMIVKYIPESKKRKVIEEKFAEIAALVEAEAK